MPDAGTLLEFQRAATENATRMANAACHYALSLNRASLDLWGSRLDECLDLPKRFVKAQTDFIEQAFDHYQESMQQLGSLATKATRDAQSAVRETEAAGDRAAPRFQSETKEMGRKRRKWAGATVRRKARCPVAAKNAMSQRSRPLIEFDCARGPELIQLSLCSAALSAISTNGT